MVLTGFTLKIELKAEINYIPSNFVQYPQRVSVSQYDVMHEIITCFALLRVTFKYFRFWLISKPALMLPLITR